MTANLSALQLTSERRSIIIGLPKAMLCYASEREVYAYHVMY